MICAIERDHERQRNFRLLTLLARLRDRQLKLAMAGLTRESARYANRADRVRRSACPDAEAS